ncbi:M14 family zinc carboxypeptidase [Nocardioides sp. 1609]|uniref:M14 family zinc carboxypeptidase n=1 Tax=Nocardioides sp. 1609 TaxID=2508327 RepID=UPI0010703B2C|nr:M14 family zinc carboxypeptidase [Nocardioides sp. 1609]
MRPRTAAGLLAALLGLLGPFVAVPGAGAGAAPDAGTAAATARPADAVIGSRTLGRTVGGRPITAYHLGDPTSPGLDTVVLFSTMHGNEPDTRHALRGLVDGSWVAGVDLWVVPVYNPDGLARGTRRNAHGVDLNRNFPYRWADLDGSYEWGPRPASEPETRAAMAFLRRVDPDWVLSFHQPLNGVDTDTKRPAFARRVAHHLGLPTRTLDCGGVCHGTMTGWFNHHFDGAALTVEYGASPSRARLRRDVPDQVLAIFDAARGTAVGEPTRP